MKTFIYILLLCFPAITFAQSGNYFLSHYSPSQKHSNNICFDMVQDERGVMYYATNGGVLEFDGKNWDVLKGNSAVYSLHINASGEIFWGGARGFGKIGYDALGFQQLETLSDSLSSNVFQSLAVKDVVYFLSDDAIYIYNAADQKTTKINATDETGSFTRLFELFGAVYANTSDQGIFKVETGAKISRSKIAITGDVTFFSKIDETYVLATSENKLFVFTETLQPKQIIFEDQEYADASVIISGSWVNRQLLALGTLRGGVMFINPITGRTQQIVNYATGLPDNEVFALMPDRNQNVWIAHDYGFTRVSPYMPFHSFSYYSGLQGNPLCAYSVNGGVYAGTSVGLFKLERENVYDELVYYVNVEVKPAKKNVANKASETTKEVEEEKSQPKQAESKKRGLFNFLRKKKNNEVVANAEEKTDSQTENKTEPAAPKVTDSPIYRREKRTKKILRSAQYTYVKVKGIDAKVNHLLEADGKLIASGLGGIYEVQGLQAQTIFDEPTRYLFASDNILFASTYEDRILAIEYKNKAWHQINSVNNLDDQVNFIFEGKKGELWVCGLNKVYQLEFTPEQISINRAIELKNPEMETTLGVSWDENIMFANTEGFFKFDRTTNSIDRIDSLPMPSQYFTHNESILYRDQHGWNLAGKQSTQGNLQLLNLFHDLRFITSDQQPGNLWMISKDNELYKFLGDNLAPDEKAFPLFLKTVINHDNKTGSRSQIHISEDKSAVTFEIVQPDFISPEAVEFRYQLEGMNEKWSDWASNNNMIDFPYLPPGAYTLRVQSKNIFGKISELDPMSFEVLPPYWKRSWFYAMEFALLATLVLLSFRLNTRYRIVSRVLSLLTIILLIQFIQTVINATIHFSEESPVIDFIIQVFVALLILPVEGYLRNLMFRSLDASSKFYQFVGPKSPEKEKLEEFEPSEEERST